MCTVTIYSSLWHFGRQVQAGTTSPAKVFLHHALKIDPLCVQCHVLHEHYIVWQAHRRYGSTCTGHVSPRPRREAGERELGEKKGSQKTNFAVKLHLKRLGSPEPKHTAATNLRSSSTHTSFSQLLGRKESEASPTHQLTTPNPGWEVCIYARLRAIPTPGVVAARQKLDIQTRSNRGCEYQILPKLDSWAPKDPRGWLIVPWTPVD